MRRPGPTTTILLVAIAAALGPVHAQDEAPREPFAISIEPPPRIALGDRGSIVARVALGPGAARPMLLTPTSEGSAVEIVRGRLTRGDAHEEVEDALLRFEIPFVARALGTSVIRVRVEGFACEGDRCRAIQIERSIAVQVLPR